MTTTPENRPEAPRRRGRPRLAPRNLAPVEVEIGRKTVAAVIDEAESPLGWLARRKGRDGQPLVPPHRLAAGERLRSDFTRGALMPRMTVDWSRTGSGGGGPRDPAAAHDTVIAARERVRLALSAVGPEFAGLLVDVCCFLKGLEAVEHERRWPARSAKVVLDLALERLARHYGFKAAASGPSAPGIRTWLAPGAAFVVE
jgi:hypothetical protein